MAAEVQQEPHCFKRFPVKWEWKRKRKGATAPARISRLSTWSDRRPCSKGWQTPGVFSRALHFLSHTPEQIHGNAKRPQGLTFTLGRDEAVNHARGLSTGSYNPEWFIRWLMRIYLIILNPILSDLHLSITLQELLFIKI